ncbi:MAG: PrsW family intramembrane metalloprotease [Oscillospiraceae bacterium]|nr:PrsW family intramembrane metalloprotease [Oscillospiraceae bacterium]
MAVFILACAVSFVPSLALLLWLRNRLKKEDAYQKLCDQTLWRGVMCIFPVILLSGCSYVLLRLTGLQNTDQLLYQALYKFIVLALMEEVAKFIAFRRVLKKTDYAYSWLDTAVLMTIVGLGFGMFESIVYAIGASVPVVLVRGICVPHAGYGFLTGYFYGKGSRLGKPALEGTGFVLSWLMHGLYDFSLSEEFVAINDNLVFIPLLLALMDIVLVLILVRFARKAKKKAELIEPLQEALDQEQMP